MERTCSTLRRKGLMSAFCNGKVVREGSQWHCLDCGCASTSWDTKHSPLQPKALHYLASLLELSAEVDKQSVVAVQPAQ